MSSKLAEYLKFLRKKKRKMLKSSCTATKCNITPTKCFPPNAFNVTSDHVQTIKLFVRRRTTRAVAEACVYLLVDHNIHVVYTILWCTKPPRHHIVLRDRYESHMANIWSAQTPTKRLSSYIPSYTADKSHPDWCCIDTYITIHGARMRQNNDFYFYYKL